MGEKDGYYLISEIADITGFHPNSIRGWIKRGRLQAQQVEGNHGTEYRVIPNDLYNSGIDKLSQRLSPDMVEAKRREKELKVKPPVELLGEFVRVNDELKEARELIGTLRQQVLMLPEAQSAAEREREAREAAEREREELSIRTALLEREREELKANLKWSYRRKLQGKEPKGA